jgi:hypothetical protein
VPGLLEDLTAYSRDANPTNIGKDTILRCRPQGPAEALPPVELEYVPAGHGAQTPEAEPPENSSLSARANVIERF